MPTHRTDMQFTNKLFRRAIEASADCIVITDTKGRITYANPAFEKTTGWTIEEAIGKNPRLLKSGQTPKAVYDDMWATLLRGETWKGRLINRRKKTSSKTLPIFGKSDKSSNPFYWAQLSISPVINEAGETTAYIAIQRDISEEVHQEKLQRRAKDHATVRAAISRTLQEKAPLKERLRLCIAHVLSLEELDVENKGGVFLAEDGKEYLKLFVTEGKFADEFYEKERTIPKGFCLCGRVAVSGELLVSDDCFCDPRHEQSFENMSAHGHYIIPLKDGQKVLGILFLYTEPYPSKDEDRMNLLSSIGELMGLAIANDQLTQQLHKARIQADAANQTKSDFLANMSHEIRTPLTAILGFAETLRDELNENQHVESVNTILRNGKHLVTLINDILDLSKIEAGRMDMESIPCGPAQVLTEVVSLMRVRAEAKGLFLNLEFETAFPETIQSDPTRLKQVILNVVGNAIKFTAQGGVTIRVGASNKPSGNMIWFKVQDTGIGMTPEQQAKLFQPFTQADNSTTRKFGGTGLGLAISKQIVNQLSGEISIESEFGNGTTFTIELPYELSEGVRLITSATEAMMERQEQKNAPQDDHITGVRVLLADDGPDNRRLISFILKKAGAQVTTVENGKEAFRSALEAQKTGQAFDVILMDMQMPVMDGYEATAKLRAEGYTLPIVALTAHAMIEAKKKCATSGCDDYATKPIDRAHLIGTVARWAKTGQREVKAS